METIASLFNVLPQVGRLEAICLRSERMGAVSNVEQAEIITGRGISGDHRISKKPGGKRQVTLIQSEHLQAVASMLHRHSVEPDLVRRNLVVSGINLLALKGKQFYVGDVLLEFSGPCEPCSRMEFVLGSGGYNAMRGHGGITARVISGGTIRTGDNVRAVLLDAAPSILQARADSGDPDNRPA
jgi:MOSC domain-containing protein YiiM